MSVVDDTKLEIYNPFPGLRPFKFGENHLFFGREHQVDVVIEKILNHRFVAIIGASGVGKSSFMSCGIISELLLGHKEMDDQRQWEVFTATPGSTPIQNLAKCLYRGINVDHPNVEEENDPDVSVLNSTIDRLLGSPEELVNVLKDREDGGSKKYLLFIDQFEEIFRFSPDDHVLRQSVKKMVDMIIYAIKQEEVPIYVVLSIRSDFVGDCAKYPLLTSAINSSQYLIPQLTQEEMQRAIVGPIEYMNGHIDPALVEKILSDVGESNDQLPVMQHALMRTWDYWKNNSIGNEPIIRSHYEAIGGMKSALSEHAREAFRELDDKEKAICERLFKTITEKGEDERGVRRPTMLKEIAAIANTSIDEIKHVVEYFRRPDRTLLMPPSHVVLDEESMIDISHESLMRNWIELIEWVDEESESVKIYLRLAEAAEMHQEGKAGLWRPPDLQIAQSWKEEQKPTEAWGLRHHKAFERTMLFLEYSEKDYERQQRIREKMQKRRLVLARIVALVLGMGIIVALLFLLYAESQRKEAELQRKIAFKNEEVAKEKEKEALIQKDSADFQKEQAMLQKERAEVEKKNAENQKLLAEYQKGLAEEATVEAKIQRDSAEKQKELAIQNKELADSASREAYRLSLLSLARAMAIKSLQISESEEKGLLARQAYNYNKEYNGKENDPDVYDGLYYALKSLKGSSYNSLEAHDQNVRSLVSDGSSKYVYSTGSDGKILRWAPEDNNSEPFRLDKESDNIRINRTLALNSKNTKLVCGGDYGYILEYNLLDPNEEPTKIPTSWHETWYLAYTQEGNIVATGSNKRIMIYKNGIFKQVGGLNEKINAIAVLPKADFVLAALQDGELISYDLSNNDSSLVYKSKYPLISVAISPNGKYMACGDERGRVMVFQSNNGGAWRIIRTLIGHTARVNNIVFSNDSKTLATGSFDKTVRIWKTDNLHSEPVDPPIVLKDHKDWVWSIVFSQNNQKLLAGCRDYLIRLWPMKIDVMAEELCGKLSKDRLGDDEWKKYVGEDVKNEGVITCPK